MVKSVDYKVSFLVLVELEVAAMAILRVCMYYYSCGNKCGTCGSKRVVERTCRFAAPSDLAGSI